MLRRLLRMKWSFCFLIRRGTVCLSRTTANGRRQVVSFLAAGDLCGFEAAETREFTAEAITEVDALRKPCQP